MTRQTTEGNHNVIEAMISSQLLEPEFAVVLVELETIPQSGLEPCYHFPRSLTTGDKNTIL